MHTFKDMNTHKCQIDCTNHDQVINKLQTKSKDLYYFWRNYQWLYNKYYNEPRKTDPTQLRPYEQKINKLQQTVFKYQQKFTNYQTNLNDYQNKCHNYEQQIQSLSNQNNDLKRQITSLNRQLQNKKNIKSELQGDWESKIKRLNQKVKYYEEIESNLSKQVNQSQRIIGELRKQVQQERKSNVHLQKDYEEKIMKLQFKLDDMRLQLTNRAPQISEIKNLGYREEQIQELIGSIRHMREQTERIVDFEMDKTRNQLRDQVSRTIYSLTRGELDSLLVQY